MQLRDWQTLAERAKELECVYAVDRVLQNRELTLPDMMTELTKIVPLGFSCPKASRICITLWADVFQTPGFEESGLIYKAPIRIEEEAVGEIAVSYRPELLEGECPLLQHEIQLIDTIALRICQLALSRQRDIALIINLLKQVDPAILPGIAEKLGVYLEHTVGRPAEKLVRQLGAFGGLRNVEVNSPSTAPSINVDILSKRMVEAAVSFLSPDTVIGLFNEWIHEQRVLALIKIVDRKDSRISDILDAVRKHTETLPGSASNSYTELSQTETWLLSELTHRFLSDDEQLINLVLNDISIPDFAPMIERIIGSERSMGNIGGKGAGIFIASQILRRVAQTDPLLSDIKTPRTWYIATDQIVDFLHYNRLEELNCYKYNSASYHRMTYENVVAKIRNACLPPQTINMLRLVLDDLDEVPLVVRSSSLLEDKHNGTFSGKYKSLFLCNKGTKQERLNDLIAAVLEVYSSMYNPDSLQYRKERGLLNFIEQMGVLIQEVVGTKIGRYFMPVYAGVAFSKNLHRWSPRISPEDGLVRLVMGLGTRAVDRINNDYPVMMAPGQPRIHINQSPEEIRKYSPKQIDLIDLEHGFTTVDATTFLREYGKDVPALAQLVSVFDNDFLTIKNSFSLNPSTDDMVITFHHAFSPVSDFAPKIKRMLEVLSEKLQCPVDIEFAFDGTQLYLLQCRRQGTGLMKSPAPIPHNLPLQNILFTANKFIPNGKLTGISHIVYVDPDGYNALSSRKDMLAVGEAVGRLNELLPRRKFALLGPGRWGSRGDIKLGVCVTYSDICNTAALIEIAKERLSYVPEPSFGTHFFQDLVEGDISYLPLYPGQDGVIFNEEFFDSSVNLLSEILPKYGYLSDMLKVIDVRAAKGGLLSLYMNSEQSQAVAFFTGDREVEKQDDAQGSILPDWNHENEQKHSQLRRYIARKIADTMNMEAFGVKGVYMIDDKGDGKNHMGNDIILLIHVESDCNAVPLRNWLDGWNRALTTIKQLETGQSVDYIINVHLVTDKDIDNGDSYALKIHSLTDQAIPLRIRS